MALGLGKQVVFSDNDAMGEALSKGASVLRQWPPKLRCQIKPWMYIPVMEKSNPSQLKIPFLNEKAKKEMEFRLGLIESFQLFDLEKLLNSLNSDSDASALKGVLEDPGHHLNEADFLVLWVSSLASNRSKLPKDVLGFFSLKIDPNHESIKKELAESVNTLQIKSLPKIRAKLALLEIATAKHPEIGVPLLVGYSTKYLMCPFVQSWIQTWTAGADLETKSLSI